ncbi:MAG TPA: FAD-dependent oxidoreductase [Candidatus Saccharimonadales bacterium]|nr:FAD-dependent oxidoreductase [Candidatus Saccharimonadales bacterium]
MFEPSNPTTWQAGQFIHITLKHDDMDDRGDERWFTISSAPSENRLVITTRIYAEKKSSFKTALLALKPGDTAQADAPEGDFVIGDSTRNHLFIAGGIGITPFRSILTEADALDEQLNVTLLYANRTNEIAYKNELDILQQSNPHLHIDYIVQPKKLDAQLLQQQISQMDDPLVYVSGPEPMVESLTAELATMGVTKDNIKGDYFPGYQAD